MENYRRRLKYGFGWLVFSMWIWIWCGPVDAQDLPDTLKQIDVLDLPTAVAIALAENPDLQTARARVLQARQAVEEARSAYWPRLDATASGARVSLSDRDLQTQQQTAAFFNSSIEDPQEYYSASLSASWLLFDGFARKFNLAGAKYAEQATEAGRADAQRLLLEAVTQTYLSAQLAQENILIEKADLEFNQRQLDEARLRYQVGTGALSDVLNFEIRVNTANTGIISANQNFRARMIALAALLGLPESDLPDQMELAPLAPPTPAELADPQIDELVELAFRLRPDLQQSEWSVERATANVKVARGDYYPTLSVLASLDGERTDDPSFETDDFGNSVGVSISYNIFAGGLYRARYQRAKASLYEAEKTMETVRIDTSSTVRTAVTRLRSAQNQLPLQRSNAELVQRNRDLVEKEYKAGVGSLVRLNEAQRDLVTAQVRLAIARVALHQAWYELQSATGEILTIFRP